MIIRRDEYSLGIYLRLANQGITDIMKERIHRIVLKIKLYSIFKICHSFINAFSEAGYIDIQTLGNKILPLAIDNIL